MSLKFSIVHQFIFCASVISDRKVMAKFSDSKHTISRRRKKETIVQIKIWKAQLVPIERFFFLYLYKKYF